MKKYLFTCLVFFPFIISAQNNQVFKIDSLPNKGIVLDKGWQWHEGDNPDFSNSDFDDSKWAKIDPTKDIDELSQLKKAGFGWLRLHINVDSPVANTIVTIVVSQVIASEIYMNGQLIGTFGKLSHNPREVIAYNPIGYNTSNQIIHFYTGNKTSQVLAVRFALQPFSYYVKNAKTPINHCLQLTLFKTDENVVTSENSYEKRGDFDATSLDYFKAGLFFILTLLHFCFYFSYRLQKANLYFGLFCLIMLIHFLSEPIISQYFRNVSYKMFAEKTFWFEILSALLFLLAAVYRLFLYNRGVISITWIIIVSTFLIWNFIGGSSNALLLSGTAFLITILINLDVARVSIIAFKNKKEDALILVLGSMSYIIFTIAYVINILNQPESYVSEHLFANLNLLSIPIGTTLFLAREFAQTTRSLAQKLLENEKLSAQTIAQEKEKQQILANQNETLEKKVTERTVELNQSLTELKSTQAQLIQSEKMASLGELTAGIAHEIQNPLNFVNNFSEVSNELILELKSEKAKIKSERDEKLEDDILNDISSNLEKILHHGKRADGIVKGMLQHSRTSTAVKEAVNINKLADEYLHLAYHGLRAKDNSFNATLKTNYDENIGDLIIIPQDIARVVLNLYNNAFYAVDEKKRTAGGNYQPTVSVRTKRLNDKVEIKVEDNGNGIPQNIVDKIFQPFFTTKPTGQGTGLGLSLSYDIIKAHGGEFKVETKEGTGTEFIVLLPAV